VIYILIGLVVLAIIVFVYNNFLNNEAKSEVGKHNRNSSTVHLNKPIDQSDISQNSGKIRLNSSAYSQVLNLKRAGRVVEAIKMVREYTGVSLVEAKEYVDSL
jgi:ribosomal protein L7/L12